MAIDPKILHYCKYQERCHSEVRSKLYDLGFTSGEVERQISGLIENGILNEERFARAFARGKFRMLQWGRDKIKQQLKLKKISDYCIRKGLSEINEEEYNNTLHKLISKKLVDVRATRSIPTKKARIFRYMIQKGYERDLIIDAINDKIKAT